MKPRPAPRTLVVEVVGKSGELLGGVLLRSAVIAVVQSGPDRTVLTLRTGRDVVVAASLAEVCAQLGWPGAVALEQRTHAVPLPARKAG